MIGQIEPDLIRRHAELLRLGSPGTADAAPAGNSTPADRPSPPSTPSGGGRTVLNGIGAHLYPADADGNVLLGLRHPDSAYGVREHAVTRLPQVPETGHSSVT